MRRGQTTLEYVYLIGIVAVAIIAILAYISRGFQGRVRTLSDQTGAGSYEPGKATITNTETKHLKSTIESKSITTTIYGNAQGTEDMRDNQKRQKELRNELKGLDKARGDVMVALVSMYAAQARGEPPAGDDLGKIQQNLDQLRGEVESLKAQYEDLTAKMDANKKRQEVLKKEIAALEAQRAAVMAIVCPPCETGESCSSSGDPPVESCSSWTDCSANEACESDKAAQLNAINRQLEAKNKELSDLEIALASLDSQREGVKGQLDAKNAVIQAYTEGLMKSGPLNLSSSIASLEKSLEDVTKQLTARNDEYNKKIAEYEDLMKNWHPTPDKTSVTSINDESGKLTTIRDTDEALGTLK